MTGDEVLDRLRGLADERYARILRSHGAREPVYGVKIEELKKIRKVVQKDHRLALELYDTGIYDAMYLAGLIVDDSRMTRKDLDRWVRSAGCPGLGEYTVAWVAAESRFGRELALKWIEEEDEGIAAAGWATLAHLLALTPDDHLDLEDVEDQLQRIRRTIHGQPNRVRYTMNGFLITAGIHVAPLTESVRVWATEIGPVMVDMGGTACKTPYAPDYIDNAERRGAIGKKRKTVKC